MRGLSLAAVSEGYSLVVVRGFSSPAKSSTFNQGKKKKKTALGLSKQRINADQGCFSKAGDDEVA